MFLYVYFKVILGCVSCAVQFVLCPPSDSAEWLFKHKTIGLDGGSFIPL